MLRGNGEGIGGSCLIIDLKFLDHSQLDEHPQGGRDHGVNVQGEIVEGELVDAQLTDQGNVGGLLDQCWTGESWRGQGSVPSSDQPLESEDVVFKSLRRLKMNEGFPTNMTVQQIISRLCSEFFNNLRLCHHFIKSEPLRVGGGGGGRGSLQSRV